MLSYAPINWSNRSQKKLVQSVSKNSEIFKNPPFGFLATMTIISNVRISGSKKEAPNAPCVAKISRRISHKSSIASLKIRQISGNPTHTHIRQNTVNQINILHLLSHPHSPPTILLPLLPATSLGQASATVRSQDFWNVRSCNGTRVPPSSENWSYRQRLLNVASHVKLFRRVDNQQCTLFVTASVSFIFKGSTCNLF